MIFFSIGGKDTTTANTVKRDSINKLDLLKKYSLFINIANDKTASIVKYEYINVFMSNYFTGVRVYWIEYDVW